MLGSKLRHANLAVSLDGWLWAVSSLATEKIQICCLMEPHIQPITPSLATFPKGYGCEGYSSKIYRYMKV